MGKKILKTDLKTDPIWGTLYPPKAWYGKVTLMKHVGKGLRYIPNDEVEEKKMRGWEVTEVIDPTRTVVDPTRPAPGIEALPAPARTASQEGLTGEVGPEAAEVTPGSGKPRRGRKRSNG